MRTLAMLLEMKKRKGRGPRPEATLALCCSVPAETRRRFHPFPRCVAKSSKIRSCCHYRCGRGACLFGFARIACPSLLFPLRFPSAPDASLVYVYPPIL